jgi:hypothetical protein
MSKTVRLICYAMVMTLTALLPAALARAEDPPTLRWMRQFGTPQSDIVSWLFVDGRGNIHLSGSTSGTLGAPNAGGGDAWVATYNSSGDRLWLHQIGTPNADYAQGVSADAMGNVYNSGTTEGNLGGTYFGGSDAFIVKYDAQADQLWSRQFGTSSHDFGQRNSVDDLGNVYIAGSTEGELTGSPTILENGFLAKYDTLGNLVWLRQRDDGPHGKSGYQGVVDDRSGHIYVAGTGDGMARFTGGIVSKYDQDGTLLWTGHVENDEGPVFGRDGASDGMGNVYLAGTGWELEADIPGDNDAHLAKFDDSGTLLWTRQLATSGDDEASTVFAENIYVAGGLGGDAFLAKFIEQQSVPGDYDANGIVDAADHLAWKSAFGSTTELAADGNRNGVVDAADYVVWRNNLASDNPSAGANAALVPEPAGIILLSTILASAATYARRRRVSDAASWTSVSNYTLFHICKTSNFMP